MRQKRSTIHEIPAFVRSNPHLLRVVCIGGGSGLANLLKGLKKYVHVPVSETVVTTSGACIADLCAVVAVSDDGGSSGRLRKEFNILPPGDIRNCIAALSEDEALLSRLFQYRFQMGSELNGHSLGNLFLTALTTVTGDFAEAVQRCSEILNTRGRIYPSTTSDVQLEAIMADGSRVLGETIITASTSRIIEIHLSPADVEPLPQTLEAIRSADLITIGPGSLFTSLVPNLLVRGIPQAIASSPAVKVLVCNLMTEANESLELTAADHIRMLISHARGRIFDYVLLNRTPASLELLTHYAEKNAIQIVADTEAIEAAGLKPILGEYLEEAAGVARHASDRVAYDLLQLTAKADADLPAIKKMWSLDSRQPGREIST
jgi:uncharacterized cofD-like protein